MSRGPRSSEEDWRPTASFEALRRRAELNAAIRAFFARRGVIEVETPLLAAATVTDLHLASLATRLDDRRLFLQTSPEFAMKRLLAAGSGPIYQICKAFRAGESGRRHNPEFTMLEWYRPGFDHHALMDEIDELLGELLGTASGERCTYAEVFERRLGLAPHDASVEQLRRAAEDQGVDAAGLDGAGNDESSRDDWLHLLLSCVIEPDLGRGRPTFVFDFPVSQAALARIRDGEPPVAERFELYVEGIEVANGYHELADAGEQRRRFEADLEARRAAGIEAVPIDEHLLAALDHGLPDCAGVAVGVDRLVMLATDADSLSDVVGFPIDRA